GSPVMVAKAAATSATVAPIGPECSSDQQRIDTPPVGTRPKVPLIEATPQYAPGIRSEPPPSLPSAIGHSPDATAAADPDDDPPVSRAGSQGLRAVPWCRLMPVGCTPNS